MELPNEINDDDDDKKIISDEPNATDMPCGTWYRAMAAGVVLNCKTNQPENKQSKVLNYITHDLRNETFTCSNYHSLSITYLRQKRDN